MATLILVASSLAVCLPLVADFVLKELCTDLHPGSWWSWYYLCFNGEFSVEKCLLLWYLLGLNDQTKPKLLQYRMSGCLHCAS